METADNVYLYNSDDTLWKATDPRNVTATYDYNNRKSVTGISYSTVPDAALPLPSPFVPRVIPSPAVTFGYDSAGNRTWMNDAPGRVDYTYDDVLSRLKEETRLFDAGGVSRSFTLKYEYNLAGQLKKITDPWNATVTYNRDRAGQETSVAATGYKHGTGQDASTFATNLRYRAWGGIKDFNNGSLSGSTNFAVGYDVRLRLTSFTGGNRTTNHIYYNDGLVKEVSDQHYGSNFLRKYEYDQVSRLTKAHAGGTAQTSSSPYSLTYGYDTWGHTTSRAGSHWSTALANFSTTYTNDRDVNMLFDAAGNVKSYGTSNDPYIHYNAASQLFTQFESSKPLLGTVKVRENYHDGEGAKVFYQTFEGSTVNGSYTTYSNHFLVRSSVLDGKVIAEFNDFTPSIGGYDSKSYVYLKGVQLAYQQNAHDATSKFVYWTYHNPTVGNYFSERQIISNGQQVNLILNEMTFDPLGSYVGLAQSQPIDIQSPFTFSMGQFIDSYSGKCYADHVETPCTIVQSAMTNGWGTAAPRDKTRTVYNPITKRNELGAFFVDWDNGFFGFVPTGASYHGGGAWSWTRPQGESSQLGPLAQVFRPFDGKLNKLLASNVGPGFEQAGGQQKSQDQRPERPTEPSPVSNCPSTWDEALPIYRHLAKEALGTSYEQFPNNLGNQYWRVVPKEGLSEAATIAAFNGVGWKSFFNGNPEHFGGSDYEKYYKGAWYHLTIGYGQNEAVVTPIRRVSFRDSSRPAPWITLHCEARFRPSSSEHFDDYMKKNYGLGEKEWSSIWRGFGLLR